MRVFSLTVQYQENLNSMRESISNGETIYQANDAIAALEDAITYINYLEEVFKDKHGFKIVEVKLESVEVGVIKEKSFPTTKRVTIFEFNSSWERPHKFQMQAHDFLKAFQDI